MLRSTRPNQPFSLLSFFPQIHEGNQSWNPPFEHAKPSLFLLLRRCWLAKWFFSSSHSFPLKSVNGSSVVLPRFFRVWLEYFVKKGIIVSPSEFGLSPVSFSPTSTNFRQSAFRTFFCPQSFSFHLLSPRAGRSDWFLGKIPQRLSFLASPDLGRLAHRYLPEADRSVLAFVEGESVSHYETSPENPSYAFVFSSL